MAVPWHRIEAFSDHFAHCAVTAGETAVVLAEADSRPELVEVATIALERLGAAISHPHAVEQRMITEDADQVCDGQVVGHDGR